MTSRPCPAILSARDEDKLRKGSPDDFLEYERLLTKLAETEIAQKHLLKKLEENDRAYDKACDNVDKFTHKVRVILRQMTLFGE